MTEKSLLKAGGKLPADDKKLFAQYVSAVIDQWQLEKPVDIMIANRMVGTWMKMRFAENCITKYGIYFEDTNDEGEVTRLRVNELAYYLKQLEADFRSYYRLLNQGRKSGESATPTNFLDWLDATPKKKKKAGRKKS